jgi:hypothetical protein
MGLGTDGPAGRNTTHPDWCSVLRHCDRIGRQHRSEPVKVEAEMVTAVARIVADYADGLPGIQVAAGARPVADPGELTPAQARDWALELLRLVSTAAPTASVLQR